MSETSAADASQIISEATLRDLDAQRRNAAGCMEAEKAKAATALLNADLCAQRVTGLDAARDFLARRIGMPVNQALAEVEAELAAAEAAAAEAGARVDRLREHERDLLGYRRILEQQGEGSR